MNIEQRSLNPDNPKQARIFYDLIDASRAGEDRNAMVVMREMADAMGFKLLGSTPQSIMEGWDVWIGFDAAPVLPDYLRSVPWRSVGSA